VIVGVILIGFLNFFVSFGLSLMTALESRRITWEEVRLLLRHLGGRFLQRPLEWFLPPAETTPAA
jgi:site-specific recombinase